MSGFGFQSSNSWNSTFASSSPSFSSTSISTTSPIPTFNPFSTPSLSFSPNSSQSFHEPVPPPSGVTFDRKIGVAHPTPTPPSAQLQQAFAQSNGVDDNNQGKATGNTGAKIGDEKNKSDSSTTESSGKSDKFMYTRILRGITHNPHFTLLQGYSKRAREKMIVGWDELFEETIDNIQSLTAKTFSANLQELQKTITELEDLGYNVARLNKRIEELTNVMDKRDSSGREISDLKAKAQNYKEEKKKLESEIGCLQAQANNAQVMVDELTDRVAKMEATVPTIDALFENLALNPL